MIGMLTHESSTNARFLKRRGGRRNKRNWNNREEDETMA